MFLIWSCSCLCPIHWRQVQSSAVITRSNIVRYCINNHRNWGRISIRCWIHNRHPIARPGRRAMGCLLLIIFYTKNFASTLTIKQLMSANLMCQCFANTANMIRVPIQHLQILESMGLSCCIEICVIRNRTIRGFYCISIWIMTTVNSLI